MSTDVASRLISFNSTKEVEPLRNCDSRRKDAGFDYLGEFKRKRNMSGASAGSRRFMKPTNNLTSPDTNNGGGQSNLSFFQVADCISEEAE